jgi:hypothetical protein
MRDQARRWNQSQPDLCPAGEPRSKLQSTSSQRQPVRYAVSEAFMYEYHDDLPPHRTLIVRLNAEYLRQNVSSGLAWASFRQCELPQYVALSLRCPVPGHRV